MAGRRHRRRAGAIAATTTAVVAASAVAGATVAADNTKNPQRKPPKAARSAAPAPGAGAVSVVDVRAADAPGGVRKVWVYRPGVPDSAAVPVVYFLHGLPGSYDDLQGLGVARELNQLIATRALPPLVLVVPDGNSVGADDPEWADSHDGRVRLETFVTGALVTAVEGSHRRDRDHRMITGFSMGGYGAMNIALHHPELYSAVASIAGYFDTDDESGIFAGDKSLLATNSPDHHVQTALQLRVMLADGADDTEPVVRGETQRFAALLRSAGASPYVDIRPGEHTLDYLRAELPRVLEFLVAGKQ